MRLRFLILLAVMSFATSISSAQNSALALWSLKWSPDGQWIARAYSDGLVIITSLNPSDQRIEIKYDHPLSDLEWSPDSSRLAAGVRGEGQITIWDIGKAELLTVIQTDPPFGDTGIMLAWNPKQNILASATFEGDGGMYIRFWDTQTYAQIGVSADRIIPKAIKWNPDGLILAVTGEPSGLKLYDTFIGDDIFPKAKVPDVYYIDWSPDGSRIGALKYEFLGYRYSRIDANKWLTILEPDTLREITQLTQPVRTFLGPMLWSPDGQRIALLDLEHVDIVDAQTGTLLESFPLDIAYNFNASWSPFGGRLAIVGAAKANSVIEDIQILVPAPSLPLLQSIQSACVPTKPPAALPTTDDLATYIEAVKADTSIPPACAADLIAVAEALQTEQTTSP